MFEIFYEILKCLGFKSLNMKHELPSSPQLQTLSYHLIILSGSPLEPSPETIRVGHMSPSMAMSSLCAKLYGYISTRTIYGF